MIVRRLCVLLDAERVYREFSLILEGESDLDFSSVMVQVSFLFQLLITIMDIINIAQSQKEGEIFSNITFFV